MVDGHFGTVVDGVFTATDYSYKGYASSGPVFIAPLSRGTVTITLSGKSRWFAAAIASRNALNYYVYRYNENHHTAFHYNSVWGRVNSDTDWTNGAFARHSKGGPFTATLTLRGVDGSVSFSVNGVSQDGVWPLPTMESFYLMLATSCGGTIAVTDVKMTMMTADLA